MGLLRTLIAACCEYYCTTFTRCHSQPKCCNFSFLPSREKVASLGSFVSNTYAGGITYFPYWYVIWIIPFGCCHNVSWLTLRYKWMNRDSELVLRNEWPGVIKVKSKSQIGRLNFQVSFNLGHHDSIAPSLKHMNKFLKIKASGLFDWELFWNSHMIKCDRLTLVPESSFFWTGGGSP